MVVRSRYAISRRNWSGARDIHLYFNQHYTYAPGAFCYALSTAGMSTATGQESSTELLAKVINNPTNRSYLDTVANFFGSHVAKRWWKAARFLSFSILCESVAFRDSSVASNARVGLKIEIHEIHQNLRNPVSWIGL